MPRAALPLAVALALAACADSGVGRKCVSPVDGGTVFGPLIRAGAAECPSKLCLTEPLHPGERTTCTATCATDDDCAASVAGSPSDGLCSAGFVCAVPTVVGALKCQRLCVCRSDLVCGETGDADGHPITPASCPNPTPTPICP